MYEKSIYKIISLSRSVDLNRLFSRFCQKLYSISSLKSQYYIGINCYSKKIFLPNKFSITLQFRNLYFQAGFTLHLKDLVRDVDAALLVFDTTSKKSLVPIEMQIPLLRAHDPIFPIILLGNKGDSKIKRDINWEDVNEYCLRNKIELYGEISLNEDREERIEALFLKISKLVWFIC